MQATTFSSVFTDYAFIASLFAIIVYLWLH